LTFREGLTVAVAWNPGVVSRPGVFTKVRLFFKANWLLRLPFLSLVIMWRVWANQGARVLERLLGFEEFLERVESDRFEHMVKTPEMFEKFLPYAMAFGVEKKWAAAIEDLYTEPPDWYAGTWHGHFRPLYLVNSMSSMSSAAATTMSSGPRSSGGSGFSGGGGFRGGGFGGGGGGGW